MERAEETDRHPARVEHGAEHVEHAAERACALPHDGIRDSHRGPGRRGLEHADLEEQHRAGCVRALGEQARDLRQPEADHGHVGVADEAGGGDGQHLAPAPLAHGVAARARYCSWSATPST